MNRNYTNPLLSVIWTLIALLMLLIHRQGVAAPVSFTTTPVTTTAIFSLTGTSATALQHWRLNGTWAASSLTGQPTVGAISVLEFTGSTTVATGGNFAASPGVYLTGGESYTLTYRRDASSATATSFSLGYSPVQDGTNLTPISNFTVTNANDFTLITHVLTPATDGVYHLVLSQNQSVSGSNIRFRFGDLNLTGPGAVFAPVSLINTATELSLINPRTRVTTAERATVGLQIASLNDPLAQLSKVEYWATDLATQITAKVGESTAPTGYSITWNNLTVGTYELRAKLLNAQGNGALNVTPLTLIVLPDALSTASFIGDAGNDEVRAMVYQPDGTLVMAVNTLVNPAGITPTLLNGATATSAGAIIRLSQDGRQVLGMARLARQLVDLSTDAQGRLYVAAGRDGAFRISADLSTIDWHKTYPDQFVHRIDAGPQGHSVVMVADETDPDDISIGDDVRIIAYAPGSNELFTRCKQGQFTTDVAIDEASQTVIAVGHKDVIDLASGNSPDVPVIRGWDYAGAEKYLGYDWSGDPASPRYLNRPTNNMANTQASRVAIGRDGKMYVLMMADGGNHVMRYDPFNIMLSVRLVGGDEFFSFSNTKSERKTVVARFEPGTGAYLLGQQLTSRVGTPPTNPGNRAGSALNGQTGNVTADAEGRVFIAADAATGPPLTVDHFPGGDTGGGYAIVLSADMTQRPAAFRVTPNMPGFPASRGRAIAALNGTTWAYGGSANNSLLYAANAQQATSNGGSEGFYTVTGGSATPISQPVVTITTPISNTARPTISGTASPSAVVTLRGPASTTGGIITMIADGSGAWSTSALTFVGGPNSVTAYASNAGGTAAPAVASFTVPGTPPLPTVVITRPLNSTNSTSIASIFGTATANAVVAVTLPASATGGPLSATVSPSGHWIASQTPYQFAMGPNSITVVVTNGNGSSAALVSNFTVISGPAAPVVTISLPDNATTVSVPRFEGNTAAFAEVILDGGSGATGSPLTVTANASGVWSASGIVFPLGDNTLTATAISPGGSSTVASKLFFVSTTNSTLPPAITIAAPSNVTALNQPTLTGSATPFSNLTIIGPASSTGGPVIFENRTCDCWSTSDIWFPAGVHTFTVVAGNEGGITTSESTFTVLGDVTPTVEIMQPVGIATVAVSPLISGTATPNAMVSVNGPASSTGGPVSLTADTSGAWSTSAIVFAPGENSITATATNTAGASTTTASFTVLVPPTIEISSPVNVTITPTPVVSGTATPGALVILNGPVSSSGGPVSLTANESGNWSTTALTFVGGPNALTAIAIGGGSLSALTTANFDVMLPPTVAIMQPVNVTVTTTTPTLSGTATPFAVVILSGPANSTGGPVSLTADAAGAWSTTAIMFAEGLNNLTVVATNEGGTSEPAITIFRVIDCSLPLLYSVRDGDWTDPATWSCGRIPTKDDAVIVRHAVVVPTDGTGDALYIIFEQTPTGDSAGRELPQSKTR